MNPEWWITNERKRPEDKPSWRIRWCCYWFTSCSGDTGSRFRVTLMTQVIVPAAPPAGLMKVFDVPERKSLSVGGAGGIKDPQCTSAIKSHRPTLMIIFYTLHQVTQCLHKQTNTTSYKSRVINSSSSSPRQHRHPEAELTSTTNTDVKPDHLLLKQRLVSGSWSWLSHVIHQPMYLYSCLFLSAHQTSTSRLTSDLQMNWMFWCLSGCSLENIETWTREGNRPWS